MAKWQRNTTIPVITLLQDSKHIHEAHWDQSLCPYATRVITELFQQICYMLFLIN